MSYPSAKTIPIPELGPGASITMNNPWMLPIDRGIPKRLFDDGNEAELETEIIKRGKERLRLLIPAWKGITDVAGNELAAPAEDPEVYERVPSIVHLRVNEAIANLERNMEWDPTKPPKKAETKENSAPKNSKEGHSDS